MYFELLVVTKNYEMFKKKVLLSDNLFTNEQ